MAEELVCSIIVGAARFLTSCCNAASASSRFSSLARGTLMPLLLVMQMEEIEPLAREHLKTEMERTLFLDLARAKKKAWLDRLSIVEATISRVEEKDSAERKEQADLLFAVLDTDQVRSSPCTSQDTLAISTVLLWPSALP